jgi:large subunit ribosomal protein L40e
MSILSFLAPCQGQSNLRVTQPRRLRISTCQSDSTRSNEEKSLSRSRTACERIHQMPIADVTKKQIAQKRRLFLKVCLRCGARNALQATRCRKCHASVLRLKNRSVGLKK